MRPDYVVKMFLYASKNSGIQTIDGAIALVNADTSIPKAEPEIQLATFIKRCTL